MPVFTFEICGLPVSLSTSSNTLFQLYADYFRYYASKASKEISSCPAASITTPLTLHFILKKSLPASANLIPAEADFIEQAGQVSFWRWQVGTRERFFFQTDTTFFRIEPQRGHATGFISEAALDFPHLLANTYTFAILLLLLRWHERYHLHTAAVVSPREASYLICGAQRAGKTTLTAALGVSGWQAISDDGILLQANERGQAEAHAFKRDFHIAAGLLQKWTGLQKAVSRYDYFDRACVDGLALFNAQQLADQPFTRVACVLFPQITGERKSRLELISSSEAIHRLIGQSMFFPLWREHTQRQMKLLTALVKDATYYRLLAGTDIWENPACAAELLAK